MRMRFGLKQERVEIVMMTTPFFSPFSLPTDRLIQILIEYSTDEYTNDLVELSLFGIPLSARVNICTKKALSSIYK